jgi:hypothetical protein
MNFLENLNLQRSQAGKSLKRVWNEANELVTGKIQKGKSRKVPQLLGYTSVKRVVIQSSATTAQSSYIEFTCISELIFRKNQAWVTLNERSTYFWAISFRSSFWRVQHNV